MHLKTKTGHWVPKKSTQEKQVFAATVWCMCESYDKKGPLQSPFVFPRTGSPVPSVEVPKRSSLAKGISQSSCTQGSSLEHPSPQKKCLMQQFARENRNGSLFLVSLPEIFSPRYFHGLPHCSIQLSSHTSPSQRQHLGAPHLKEPFLFSL